MLHHVVRYLPEWFPGAKFHTVARDARKLSHIYKNEIYTLSKKKLVRGLFINSLMGVID